jgi:phage terminase large subunit GpA-like protein
MATEHREWYWGIACPKCGEMSVYACDPMRGLGGSEKPSETQVTLTCPNGHPFSARTEDLIRFEWGGQ